MLYVRGGQDETRTPRQIRDHIDGGWLHARVQKLVGESFAPAATIHWSRQREMWKALKAEKM
jgi:hypothetical protein